MAFCCLGANDHLARCRDAAPARASARTRRMERKDAQPRQRGIIYAAGSRRRRHHDALTDSNSNELARDEQRQQQRTGAAANALSVPSWFDLPLVLPDTNPIGARVQRSIDKLQREYGDERSPSTESNHVAHTTAAHHLVVPKVSQLSPTKDVMRRRLHTRTAALASTAALGETSRSRSNTTTTFSKVPTIGAVHAHPRVAETQQYNKHPHHIAAKSRLHKKRQTTHAGAPVVLDRIDRKSRLREKIWRDLSRFGLWYFDATDDGESDSNDNNSNSAGSIDKTVDAIMQQWDAAAPPLQYGASSPVSSPASSATRHRPITAAVVADPIAPASTNDTSSALFLTALPSESTQPLDGRHSRSYGDDDDNAPEDDNDDNNDSDSTELSAGASGPIRPPGMKRRQRLKELHHYVEKQLQRRLFKSWDTIELAFTGSGDLTVAQITKFLQHSDVQLSAADAAKVHAILDSHTKAVTANANAAEEDANAPAVTVPAKPATVSFGAFHRIFHTKDVQESIKWRREFERDKSRQQHEKEIYEKELAALEEKVKKRLAESAAHMIDVLAQFRVDPLALPWETDAQRLELRAQFLETIFTKPQRRIQATASFTSSDTTALRSSSAIPSKLSAALVGSALLQKYSRNGHFDAIEVDVAAYLFHDVVASCIQASVRRWFAKRAADAWPERQQIFAFRRRKVVFLEWRRFTTHAETLRRYVLRKFVAWQFFTRKRYEHYAFVRVAFWPFYTWKRHLQQQIIARGKSLFLVDVVRTYVQLRHFRALQHRLARRKWNARHIARLRAKRTAKLLTTVWTAWVARSEARLRIRSLWASRGHALQRLHKLYMVRVTFALWRYYSILRHDMRRRQFLCLLERFPSSSTTKRLPTSGPQSNSSRRCGSRSFAQQPRNMHQQHQQQQSASWYLSAPHALDAASPAAAADAFSSDMSNHIDSIVDDMEDADDDDGINNASSAPSPTAAPTLTRIMETELGQCMKRKSRLYDLCLALYLTCRAKDRRTMIGNVIALRRAARLLFTRLRALVVYEKKHRFATDLGSFRVLHARWMQWKLWTHFQVQRSLESDATAHAAANHIALHANADADASSSDDETNKVGSDGSVTLHWRRDRTWRRRGIEQNPLQAQQLLLDLDAVFTHDAQRAAVISDRERALERKHAAEASFLRKEAGATLKVKSAQQQQAQQILRLRGQRLHDALDRVFDDLLRQRARQQLRSSFRSLRVVVMLKYTTTLCHRAQLRNWLRLCRRFMFWDRHIAAFARLQRLYRAFQALLKHAVWKWQFQSPGLAAKLSQRSTLVTKYERFLATRGLLDNSDAAMERAATKLSPANTLHGVLLRWVQWTQFAHATQRIVALARERHALTQLQSVFVALRHHVKSVYTLDARRQARPFLLRQVDADLDAYHCKLLALRTRLPSTMLRRTLQRQRQRLLQVTAGSPTLKQRFQVHEADVRRRLRLEQRLMFSAYAERRVHHYTERSSPLFGAPLGRSFAYEPAPPYGSISDIAVICSKRVDGISLVVKTNAAATHDGALHGNPFGNREVFALAKGEVLVSIEGFASQTLYGLRFGTSSGRLSKWFGHCDKGSRFEIRSDFTSVREEIVGVFGYADATSLHAIGAVLRRTTQRNIFEGLWLHQDATPTATLTATTTSTIDVGGVALCDRQFAYFLQVRQCDVLLAMKRAHRLALSLSRTTHTPPALSRQRVAMALARWLFNALAHGLVQCTIYEDDGKRLLEHGTSTRARGEKSLADALHTLELVDSFRDSEQQLDVATLGTKKIAELRGMMEHAQQRIVLAKQQIDDGQRDVAAAQRILPHVPMTKRMMSAIRQIYRVVQTKDYIDQMDPDMRAILLVGDSLIPPSSSAESIVSLSELW